MNRTQCRDQLITLLQAQTTKVGIANEYLVNIKNAIAQNRIDALATTLENPTLPIDDIEQLEQQRYQLQHEFGFEKTHAGLEQCIDWCDSSDEQVSRLYQQLVQSLMTLQHSIQLNHLLVNKGKDRIRRSIGILTGLGQTDQVNTYTSRGEAGAGIGRRDIAVA